MRYALITIGVIVALVLIVVVVGWTLPVRHRASVARTYNASPSTVFSLITDVQSFPSWRKEVTRVELLADADGHTRWREVTGNGPPITFVVDRSIPDRLLVARIADTNLAFGGTWTYELTPAGNGVGGTTLRITEDGEVYNPLFRFVSRFVMGHEATIKQYQSAVGTRLAEVPDAAPR
jgi:uncharacterized protein YndB with AHSA1/START domain